MRKSEDISVAHGWRSMEAAGLKHAMNPDKLRLAQKGKSTNKPVSVKHFQANHHKAVSRNSTDISALPVQSASH